MAYANKNIVFSNDMNAFLRALKQINTIAGWTISETSPASMAVVVAPGSGWIGGSKKETTENTQLNVDASGSLPRRDIIVWDSVTDALKIIKGTAAAIDPEGETNPLNMSSPAPPQLPNANDILIGEIYVGANVTEIVQSAIFDKRFIVYMLHEALSGVAADQHNDTKVRTKEVDETAIADGKILEYKSASGKLEYVDKPAGGGAADHLEATFTAGQTITAKEAVYMYTNGKILTGSVGIGLKGVGIALNGGNVDDPITVAIVGKAVGIAAGNITAGDMLVNWNSGRLKSAGSLPLHAHKIARAATHSTTMVKKNCKLHKVSGVEFDSALYFPEADFHDIYTEEVSPWSIVGIALTNAALYDDVEVLLSKGVLYGTS